MFKTERRIKHLLLSNFYCTIFLKQVFPILESFTLLFKKLLENLLIFDLSKLLKYEPSFHVFKYHHHTKFKQFHFAYTIQIINRLSNHEIDIIIQNMLNVCTSIRDEPICVCEYFLILTFHILIII